MVSRKRRRAGCYARPGRRRKPAWADLPTDRLLDVRLCDLGVRIEGSVLEARIEQVCEELSRRGLRFRPHFWVSEEWFTPQGVGGCAVPFYLLHPRLTRLERSRMLEAEGAGHVECMKLLRHEVGHAIDHAYRLHLRRKRQRLFGKSSKPYPKTYKPKPFSRSYVQHLDYWYAQGASGRGLCGGVRGVASSTVELAEGVRGVAGDAETAVRGRGDGGDRGEEAAGEFA